MASGGNVGGFPGRDQISQLKTELDNNFETNRSVRVEVTSINKDRTWGSGCYSRFNICNTTKHSESQSQGIVSLGTIWIG